jgi:hypothetical protein
MAKAYLGVGDLEMVFKRLNVALSDRNPRLFDFIKGPYIIDAIRTEERFKEIYKRMNLEQAFDRRTALKSKTQALN